MPPAAEMLSGPKRMDPHQLARVTETTVFRYKRAAQPPAVWLIEHSFDPCHSSEFDDLLVKARAELDAAKRKEMYSKMGMIVRNEGGLICPMFNDFVDAVSNDVMGWETDPNAELMNGYITHKTWLA